METVTIRVYPSDLQQWKRNANLLGMSVSEWIRRQCNLIVDARTVSIAVQPGSEQGNGSADNQDVPRVRAHPVRGRRTTPAGRGHSRTVRGAATPGGNGTAPRTKRTNPATVVVGETALACGVTAENFAELAATLPPSELDFWARNLPAEVLPKHSATSLRLTCLCHSCLSWRKSNSIPYGGLPKKEKK